MSVYACVCSSFEGEEPIDNLQLDSCLRFEYWDFSVLPRKKLKLHC
jgi:hypothetical protein